MEKSQPTPSPHGTDYRKLENIRIANFHVINFRVKNNFVEAVGQQKVFNAKISYTCTWQHHSEKLKTSSSIEEFERACSTEATMNIK